MREQKSRPPPGARAQPRSAEQESQAMPPARGSQPPREGGVRPPPSEQGSQAVPSAQGAQTASAEPASQPAPPELVRFVRGELDPRTFTHREHVRMAFEMLRRHSFVETALHYSRALRTMTEKIGKPEVFHQTLTIAFLSLIAERMHTDIARDFESFAAANPDLMDKSAVARCYSPERLSLDAARRTFILPGPTR